MYSQPEDFVLGHRAAVLHGGVTRLTGVTAPGLQVLVISSTLHLYLRSKMSLSEPKFLLWWKLSAAGAFFLGQRPPSFFMGWCELPNAGPWPAGVSLRVEKDRPCRGKFRPGLKRLAGLAPRRNDSQGGITAQRAVGSSSKRQTFLGVRGRAAWRSESRYGHCSRLFQGPLVHFKLGENHCNRYWLTPCLCFSHNSGNRNLQLKGPWERKIIVCPVTSPLCG